jgi:hypothetical protein
MNVLYSKVDAPKRFFSFEINSSTKRIGTNAKKTRKLILKGGHDNQSNNPLRIESSTR